MVAKALLYTAKVFHTPSADICAFDAVGETVDEAVYLFSALERMCQAQLLIEAALGGGNLTKKVIGDAEAAWTAATLQYPENVYANAQTEFDLLRLERGHFFLQ